MQTKVRRNHGKTEQMTSGHRFPLLRLVRFINCPARFCRSIRLPLFVRFLCEYQSACTDTCTATRSLFAFERPHHHFRFAWPTFLYRTNRFIFSLLCPHESKMKKKIKQISKQNTWHIMIHIQFDSFPTCSVTSGQLEQLGKLYLLFNSSFLLLTQLKRSFLIGSFHHVTLLCRPVFFICLLFSR